MRPVLITGFEPFNEHAVNPSQIIAERLSGCVIGNTRIIGLTLPVAFGEDTKIMRSAIDELDPVVILSFGLDAAARALNVEMFAINHRSVDDNHALDPIVDGGPAAYFATIDVDRVAKAMSARADIPVIRHGYAGSYRCNHVFYQTLHYTCVNQLRAKVGFVHIPHMDEYIRARPDLFVLSTARMLDAVRAAIDESLANQD